LAFFFVHNQSIGFPPTDLRNAPSTPLPEYDPAYSRSTYGLYKVSGCRVGTFPLGGLLPLKNWRLKTWLMSGWQSTVSARGGAF
jgi:hypothetical protein